MMQLYIVYRLLLWRKGDIFPLLLIVICWAMQAFCDPEGDTLNRVRYNFMGGVLPFKSDALLSLKAGADAPIGTQQHIDRLAAAALHKGVGSFKRAFEPVLKMIENADSLEQLRELMEDDTAVAELYAAMDVSEVEELLQKVMLYADLEGRVVEDG